MTTEETNNKQNDPVLFKYHPNKRGRMLAGFIVVIVGGLFLLRNTGNFAFPDWLFTWPSFLIVLGLFIGAKHSFRQSGWWVVSLVGLVFLLDRIYDNISIGHLFWPVLIIAAGLVMIFKPKKKWNKDHWRNRWREKCDNKDASYSDASSSPEGYDTIREKWEKKYSHYSDARSNPEDYIDSTCIFGEVKKNVISKDFKGGEIVCVFGGAEINLMQADIKGRVELEVTMVFGGAKLVVPAHWEVVPDEMVAILGSIEDKRPPANEQTFDGTKVLVIKGTTIFGGIDIRSY